MMGELNAVILEIGLKQDVPKYLVIVIPQEESHRKLIESILRQMFPDKDPAENEREVDGGFGFVVAECGSPEYADIIAEEQRQTHRIMTIVKIEKKT